MNYFALAVAPGIAIILFILYKDRYNKEPRINLIVSFVLGCISIIPAAALEKALWGVVDGSITGLVIFAYAVVAGTEELVKFICLRFYSYRQKSFDEPLDGIVYSLMVSMGFATVENILYVNNYAALGRGVEVGLQRAFMAVPAHAAFAVLMGYYMGKAKFSTNKFGLMLWGFLLAVFFHGSYDFFLFFKSLTYFGGDMSELALIGGAIATLIIGVLISFTFIRRQRKLSMETYFRNQELLRQQQQELLQQQHEQQNSPFSA
jgi:RsiW-degrading membrane proteinase PrsW (M82 family)